MSYFSFGVGVKDVSAKASDQETGSDDKKSDDVKDTDDSNSEDKES